MPFLLVGVGAITLVAAAIIVTALVRGLSRLATSVERLEREALPALEELQRMAEETRRRAARVAERAAAMAPGDG